MAQEGAKVVVNDPGVGPDGVGTDDGPADQVVAEIKAAGGTAVANHDTVATSAGGEGIIKTALDSFGRARHPREQRRHPARPHGVQHDGGRLGRRHRRAPEGALQLIQPASVLMRQQRYGRIINFSSESGLWGNAGQANYGAAKSGIAGLTRVVARDLGRYGVTCNAIAPRAATRLTATIPQNRPGGSGPPPPPDDAAGRRVHAPRPGVRRADDLLPGDRPRLERQRADLPRVRRHRRRCCSTRRRGARSSSRGCGRWTSYRRRCRRSSLARRTRRRRRQTSKCRDATERRIAKAKASQG